jgi:starvation-inducible DNA-binding protein
LHSFTDFLKKASLVEAVNKSDARSAVETVIIANKTLLGLEHDILMLAGEVNDEGTSALMSDYIRQQEESVWMYSSFLN